MTDAQTIYQAHLDRVSQAIWASDFETVMRHKAYPNRMHFPDRTVTFAEPDPLAVDARQFRATLANLGATAYHRICTSAAFDPQDADRVIGSHRTYVLRGGNYVVAPYACDMVLVRRGDDWLTTDITVPDRRAGLPGDSVPILGKEAE